METTKRLWEKIALRLGIFGLVLGAIYPLVPPEKFSLADPRVYLAVIDFPAIIFSLLYTTRLGLSPLSCIGSVASPCPPRNEFAFQSVTMVCMGLFNFFLFVVIGALVGLAVEKMRAKKQPGTGA